MVCYLNRRVQRYFFAVRNYSMLEAHEVELLHGSTANHLVKGWRRNRKKFNQAMLVWKSCCVRVGV